MNIDSVLKMIEQEFSKPADLDDIPDFLLVANRVPLTPEQQERLAAIKVENPTVEEKWQRNRRLYEAEGERQKILAAEVAKPAREAFFAKRKAEAAELKAVRDAAKAQKGKTT